jgi:hypothetical protein
VEIAIGRESEQLVGEIHERAVGNQVITTDLRQ